MIVPSSNLTMETELPRMMRQRESVVPEDRFVFHSSRMRMQHVTPEQLRAMNAQTERAALELADARPDVVATACLVAIMAQGPGHHCTAEDEITGVLRAQGAEAPVVSSAGALLDGIRALGAGRVAIVTPYMKPLTDLVARYIESEGIGVVDAVSLEVDDNREVGRLDTANLPGVARAMRREGADAVVLSACVQMPSLAAVPAVEEECGLPVLTAATATAFELLSALGHSPQIDRAGRLLTGAVVAADV
jgi:maleate isomerase